ncbi:polysaccharide biosynthesis/export family protein [Bradyrhizobium jicamae]|uniref:polysaccharide biosynthesis/export family protein n=1 Tax=Bradyrhizobium jicamae TaxID=280332 RepID=UPI000A78E366
MRVVRAFRIPITAIITALALSGCMSTTGPVAVAPQGDLDSVAYGSPGSPPPPQAVVADSGGGAVAALRTAFASAPRAAPPPIVMAAPVAYVEPASARHDAAYHLDAGDKLRVVVYGQEGLTNTYSVSAGGSITMPLIGSVPARGRTTAGLAAAIAAKLRAGFIREPSVAVEIEAYRPFFILGEVAAPGQYPYVPNMTVESAVAIAGGFSPRARRDSVTVTHTDASGTSRLVVPPGSPISPGDTVLVSERWF